MIEILERIRNKHDSIFIGILAIVCLFFIVLVFPKDVKFKYEFQKGQPWLHENLIAPFDFAILKPDETYQNDLKKTKENFKPYFTINASVKNLKIQEFEKEYDDLWETHHQESLVELIKNKVKSNLSNDRIETKEFIYDQLEFIYDSYIVDYSEILEEKQNDYVIKILSGNRVIEKSLEEVFTIKKANLWIFNNSKSRNNVDSSFVQKIIDRYLSPNLFYDPISSNKFLNESLANVLKTRGVVIKNEKIIDKGEVVAEQQFQKLQSLKNEYEKKTSNTQNAYLILLGQIVLVGITIIVLILFLRIFRKDIINVNNRMTYVLVVFTLSILMGSIAQNFPAVKIYMIPFCLTPILIRTFFDESLATIVHILSIILIGFLAPNGFEFVFIQIITGIAVVFYLKSLRKRSQMLLASVIIFTTYSITYLGFAILHEGSIVNINWNNLVSFGISSLLILLSYPLIFLFEKIFGFLSDVTLLELSDTNSKLLRELSTVAPGTFQHSMQVANLAESAILKIGGDPLLVRTGALYHDIGKMKNPVFFIENQVGGINPHDEISYKESARVIINHVIHGIELAKKHALPEIIIDFIRTHHGTTMTRYFYINYKNENPEKVIEESIFTYPGPIPFSKETAVLMMADSVEAASRSLKSYSKETIGNLVEKIIDVQANENQFINSDITFNQLTEIKKMFKSMLLNIYHVRIEYPK